MAGGTLVRELAAGALVDATFAVSRKERRTRRDGRPFLDLELTDKSGRVRARVWDGVPVLEQPPAQVVVDDVVRRRDDIGQAHAVVGVVESVERPYLHALWHSPGHPGRVARMTGGRGGRGRAAGEG